MTHDTEIPSDAEVLAMLGDRGPMSATALVTALCEAEHDYLDAKRAVHRCLNRGSIALDADMNLVAREYA